MSGRSSSIIRSCRWGRRSNRGKENQPTAALARPFSFMIGSALIAGLGLGSMYGLLALGFYVTYAVSSTVNFAQGSSMMLGAVFAYTFAVKLGGHFIPAAATALVLCALYGLVVELAAVRPFARRGS